MAASLVTIATGCGQSSRLSSLDAPTVSGTRPDGPANDNLPLVLVRSSPGALVTLHRASDCSDDPAATGTAGEEEFGIAVGVADDSTTTFWARATRPREPASACSTTSATYVEDSTPPDAPILTGSEPPSPAADPEPDILGASEADASITVFLGEDCETVLAEGTALDDGTFLIGVELPPGRTTALTARATDVAGNVSECSEPLFYRDRGDLTLSVAFPPARSQTDQANIIVRGSIDNPEDVVAVRVEGIAATTEDEFSTWSALVPLGRDGDTSRLGVAAEMIDGEIVRGPVVEVRRATVPNLSVSDIVVDPERRTAYVTDIFGGEVLGIDLESGQATALPNGGGPRVIEPFTLEWEGTEDSVLVGSIRGGQLLRIDVTTGAREEVSGPVRGTGPTLSGVRRITFDGERTAYVATTEGARPAVMAIDTVTGDRRIIPGLTAVGLFRWDPTTDRLVYFSFEERAFLTLDPDTGVIDVLSGTGAGTGPEIGIALDAVIDTEAGELIVTRGVTGSVMAIDLETGDRSLVTIPATLGIIPNVAFDEAERELIFVGTASRELVWRVPRSGGPATSVFIGGFGEGPSLDEPTALALDGARLFVADDGLDAVFAVDLGTGNREELSRASELGDPVGLAYDPVGGLVYVRDLAGQIATLDPDTPGAPIGRIDVPPPLLTSFTHVGIDVDGEGRRLFIANRPAFVQVWDLEAGRLEDVSTVSRGDGPLPFGFLPRGLAWTGTEVVVGDTQSALIVAPDDGDREDVSDGGGPSLGSFLGLDADDDEIWLAANQGIVAVDRTTRIRRVVASATNGRGPAVGWPFDVALMPGGDVALAVSRTPTGILAIDRVTLERVLISR